MAVRTIHILMMISSTYPTGNVHIDIVKWWNDISSPKPYKCSSTLNYAHHTQTKISSNVNKLIEAIESVPYIRTMPCSKYDMVPSENYVFKGNVTNGQIVGLGKLKFISGSPQEDNTREQACFIDNMNLVEVVGTFVNGTLEGPAKVISTNGRIILSNFVHGLPFGPTRTWESNDERLQSYSYQSKQSAITIGRKWVRHKDMLVWTSESSLVQNEDELCSIVVPMNTSDEIVAGKYNSATGLVDQLYSTDIEISSSPKDCLLSLSLTLLSKKDYALSLTRDGSRKIPLGQHQNKPLCHFFQDSGRSKIRENFIKWESIMKNVTLEHGLLNAFELFYYVKPESSKSSRVKDIPIFMDNVTLFANENRLFANLSIWEGALLPWELEQFGLDKEGNLHGTCKLSLENQYVNQTGTIDFFPWSINFITGRFINGLLDGVVILGTWQGTILFASFQEGILHGPAFGIIRQPMYDIWVSFENYQHRLFFLLMDDVYRTEDSY